MQKNSQHQRGEAKTSRIPIKIEPTKQPLKKPEWIRIKLATDGKVNQLKNVLRQHKLHTVCEEATCPNLHECFAGGTATFMIMGDICTRRCPFCDVAHGRPEPLDDNEPQNLADTIAAMNLNYVVITSVDRDDLKDGGAAHFANCIQAIRQKTPHVKIEILVPDFRGRLEPALNVFQTTLPDIFNHNLETVPRLYKQARPGADYQWSLQLIKTFKNQHPHILTKSGLMVGLGEETDEVIQVMQDLCDHGCDMLTIGQYLQPTRYHLPVKRYVTPEEFDRLKQIADDMGFKNAASAPLVRSSYHAEQQATF